VQRRRLRCQETFLAVAGEFSLIQRVSDIVNGIIAKKDAIG
jgi:hypothetical protein